MAKIISVVNQKGGTGKSACAANLGVGLALMNKKVLVVDADPQSDVSAGFGFRDCDNSNETLTTLMEMVLNDEDIPEDCFIQHTEEGIDIICSNIGLAGTEVQLVNAMSREFVLKQILKQNGICPHCGGAITVERGFRIHTEMGADYKEKNILLHADCHRELHYSKKDDELVLLAQGL